MSEGGAKLDYEPNRVKSDYKYRHTRIVRTESSSISSPVQTAYIREWTTRRFQWHQPQVRVSLSAWPYRVVWHQYPSVAFLTRDHYVLPTPLLSGSLRLKPCRPAEGDRRPLPRASEGSLHGRSPRDPAAARATLCKQGPVSARLQLCDSLCSCI